jgi:hypothetical protein
MDGFTIDKIIRSLKVGIPIQLAPDEGGVGCMLCVILTIVVMSGRD